MNRRNLLKKIGLSIGTIAVTPFTVNLFQSCKNDLNWKPVFFKKENINFLSELADLIIPSSKEIPGSKELDLLKFVDVYISQVLNNEEQKILHEIINSKFKEKCIPLDNLSIAETLPIIKNCNISICNDTSFSHLSSALGIKTITLMADTPLIYGSYSSKMFPIIPDGEETVTHNTLGKEKISPQRETN